MFGQDDPVPPPHSHFFSSDFGNSHDPAGLGWGHVPLVPPRVATLLTNGESTSIAWPTLGSRTAEEQNRTERHGADDDTVMRACNVAVLCGRGRCADVAAAVTSPTTSSRGGGKAAEAVELDLLHGIVKGYSRSIQFVVTPSPTDDRTCSAQAVLRSAKSRPSVHFVRPDPTQPIS